MRTEVAATTTSTGGCAYDGDATAKYLQNGGEDPAYPEGGSSSGSSTVEGINNLALQIKDIDEETPLLHDGHTLWPLH